jgi:RNA polymerase subunit RPABC4/transcription elongation factor Spt4
MTPEEIKAKSEATAEQIARLEQAELASLAELGRKLLPGLSDSSEHASLASSIKDMGTKLATLRREKSLLDEEYKQQLAALTCFVCKAVSPTGSRFCEECGGKLGEPPREYCKSCGTMNGPNLKFCGECGARLL